MTPSARLSIRLTEVVALKQPIRNVQPTASAQSPRERFVGEVVAAFERAGVEFVLLHGHDAEARDSDLDVAVTRQSLGAVDALVRAGTFGRMLQRLHYGVPWYFTYVIERRETEQRYRELDVACDPWGDRTLRAGSADCARLHKAQPGRARVGRRGRGRYLALKRSQKGVRDERERRRLTAAAREHWQAAGALLEPRLGSRAGPRSGRWAFRDRSPTKRWRRSPPILSGIGERHRAWSSGVLPGFAGAPARAAADRARRGPRGTGWCGEVDARERAGARCCGGVRRVDRRHLGPGLLPPPARLLGRRPSDGAAPHAKPESGTIGATARLAYLWADALLGWLPRMAVPRARSSLVILERGWFDLAVDPRRYRLSPRPRTVRLLGRLLPRPDLVLLLDARADQVQARKDELELGEIERQLREWRTLLPRAGRRTHRVDATGSPEELLERVRELIHRELEGRHSDVASATLPLRTAGSIARGGRPMALVEVDGRPRWLIPRRLGGRGPLRAGLYRPARARQVPAALALEAMAAAGRLGTKLPIDLERGLLPALRGALATGTCDSAQLPSPATACSECCWRSSPAAGLSVSPR